MDGSGVRQGREVYDAKVAQDTEQMHPFVTTDEGNSFHALVLHRKVFDVPAEKIVFCWKPCYGVVCEL